MGKAEILKAVKANKPAELPIPKLDIRAGNGQELLEREPVSGGEIEIRDIAAGTQLGPQSIDWLARITIVIRTLSDALRRLRENKPSPDDGNGVMRLLIDACGTLSDDLGEMKSACAFMALCGEKVVLPDGAARETTIAAFVERYKKRSATLVAVVLVAVLGRPDGPADDAVPETLLPALAGSVNDVEALDIVAPGGRVTVSLRRDDERWRVAQKDGYEAEFAQVLELTHGAVLAARVFMRLGLQVDSA